MASGDEDAGGVAFWAHVGGFIAGICWWVCLRKGQFTSSIRPAIIPVTARLNSPLGSEVTYAGSSSGTYCRRLAICLRRTVFLPICGREGPGGLRRTKVCIMPLHRGRGAPKLALDQVGSKLKPEVMKRWIKTPKEMKADSTMKPYPNLPEKDLSDLIAFLTGLK